MSCQPGSVRLLSLVFLLALIAPSADAAKKKKPEKEVEEPPATSIGQWLVLGPAPHPMPVFHDAKKLGFDLDALLVSDLLPEPDRDPRVADSVAWFGSEPLSWRSNAATSDGTIAPGGREEDGVQVAWATSYLKVNRFMKLKLHSKGAHPRRIAIDGQEIAKGKGDTVGGDVSLTPGRHILEVQTVKDPDIDEAWEMAVSFSAKVDKDQDASKEKPAEAAVPAPPIESTIDPSHGVRLADVIDAPTVASLALAPDGNRLALSVTRIVPGTHKRESWIELRGMPGGAIQESWRGRSGVGSVQWSPDGRYLSYTASAAEGEGSDLILLDTVAGTARPLMSGVKRLGSYSWNPTGRSIVFSTSVEGKEFENGVKRLTSPRDRWATFRTKSRLHLVRVPDGVQRLLTAGAVDSELAAISPDGNTLLFTRSLDALEARPYTDNELWSMDLRDFSAKKLRTFGWMNGVAYSPDGKTLLVQARASEFGPAGVNVPDGMVSNSYDGQLFLWNPETDEARPLTRDFDPSIDSAQWSTADGLIYLVAGDRDRSRLYRCDPQTGSFSAIETGVDSFGGLNLARDARLAVGTGSSPWTPQRLVAINLEGDASNSLPHPADPQSDDLVAGDLELFDFDASTGKRIQGRYYLPQNFDPAKKYPMIVYYYGGTSPTGRGFGGRYPKEWWSSNGYVVYVLQPSGATGFGQEFAARHVNDWGKTSSTEIIEGTKKFLDAHEFVDPARVGCIGASYGGFMTMLLTTRTDLFSAAVSHAGISSLSSYWGEGYWGYLYSSVATANSFPWNRPDIYVDQSPLFRADRNKVPILLTHGTGDTNVPVGESDQFYIALKLLGKEVEYVQVEGANHWVVDHEKRMLWSRTILAWFDRQLKGEPEWWDALYPD